MKKKLFLKAGTAVAAFLITAASGQAHSGNIRSGFYTGLSAGVSSLAGNQDFTHTNSVAPVGNNAAHKFKASGQSAGVSIFGGYGHRVNCTWLGAELSYLLDRVESKENLTPQGTTGTQVFKARSTGAFGLSFHVGYIPNEQAIFYGILGLESRRFQVSAQDQLQDGATQFRENVSKKYNSWGFVPGVGARISLTKAVSLKAEYKYALHRSKTITASAANPAVGGTDTGTLKTAPRIQTFHVGVVYSF